MNRHKVRELANQLLREVEIVKTGHIRNHAPEVELTNPLRTMFSGDDSGAKEFYFGLVSLHIATRNLRDTRLDYPEFLCVESAIRRMLPHL